MSSLKKYNNSNLASSNMINARREEVARLERQRLEVIRKMEALSKRYSKLTGDRKPGSRKRRVGLAPNDWKPTINASGIKPPMSVWVKLAIILGVALFVAFMIHAFLVLNGIDLVRVINDFVRNLIEPV
jgi:hypothetical protein